MSDIHHIGDLIPDPRNARKHTPRNVGMIEKSLHEVGAARSIVIDEDGKILAGNATIEAAAIAGIENVQVVEADGNTIIAVRRSGLSDTQKTKLALYDNRAAELADWDAEVIAAIALEDDGALDGLFNGDELADIVGDLLKEAAEDMPETARLTLAERFIVPPFSVLDARQGYWQERKRAWLALGIKSELGRGENIVPNGTVREPSQDGCYQRGYGKVTEREKEIESNVENGAAQRPDATQAKVRRGYARCFGQDLMRGEHRVGEN